MVSTPTPPAAAGRQAPRLAPALSNDRGIHWSKGVNVKVKLLVRLCLVLSLIFLTTSICGAQEKPNEVKTLLGGDPRCAETFGVDSCLMTTAPLEGKVVEVIDGQTVVVIPGSFVPGGKAERFEKGHKIRLRLASISVPTLKQPLGKEAKRNLEKLVLGKIVSVQTFCTAKNVTITTTTLDAGMEQIKAGFARFDGSTYDADAFTRCHYRLAAEKAKDEKLGIWKRDEK
jgi:endonuclease YncB( thermonuclease family)